MKTLVKSVKRGSGTELLIDDFAVFRASHFFGLLWARVVMKRASGIASNLYFIGCFSVAIAAKRNR